MVYVHIDAEDVIDDLSDDTLIGELKYRGYNVYKKSESKPLDIGDLDNLYKEFFGNENQFRAYVKKLLMDNGYHP